MVLGILAANDDAVEPIVAASRNFEESVMGPPAITGNVTVTSEVQNYPLVVWGKREGLQRSHSRRIQPFEESGGQGFAA
jgi:hypothetical protein